MAWFASDNCRYVSVAVGGQGGKEDGDGQRGRGWIVLTVLWHLHLVEGRKNEEGALMRNGLIRLCCGWHQWRCFDDSLEWDRTAGRRSGNNPLFELKDIRP